MSALRLVQFDRPADFLEAMKQYDDSSLNFTLGSLLDNMDDNLQFSQAHWGPKTRILLSVYRGDDLILTLTKNAKDFSWMMATPSSIDPSQDALHISAAAKLLASYLPTIIDPTLVDKVIGPKGAVNAFIVPWVTLMASRGVYLKALPPYFNSRGCHATRSTLPPHCSTLADYHISLAGPDDVEDLIPLNMQFSSHGPHRATAETARAAMGEAVEAQKVWISRIDGGIAGYVMVGRSTPHTIAIRCVFVLPQCRRRGIAEALVTVVTRYYLGVQPLGFEGAPSEGPPGGHKAEVCLNAADPSVEGLYRRCGFMLDDNARDPATGKKGSFRWTWRGVEPS
ncbi:hypothetical protein BKA93DRAFT_744153 [Sparassis latifolia]